MRVAEMIEQVVESINPDTRCFYLGDNLWAQFIAEEHADLIEAGHSAESLQCWVAGVRVLHDPRLPPGAGDPLSWPDGIDAKVVPALLKGDAP